MDVERIIATLGLDPERVIAKASATEDYARVLSDRAREEPERAAHWQQRAASAQTVSGSLWMLVQPEQAFAPMASAEDVHAELGSAFGSLLSICAHPRRPTPPRALPTERWTASGDRPRPDIPPQPRLQPEATLLAHIWPLATGESDERLRSLLSDAPLLASLPGSLLTGRLRVPLAHYRGVAADIDRMRHSHGPERHSGQGRPLSATRAFLERVIEVIEAVRENEHQWRNLRSPVLPVEPEAIATCVLVELAVRHAFDTSAVELMDVSSESLVSAYLGIAQNVVDADADTDTGTDLEMWT